MYVTRANSRTVFVWDGGGTAHWRRGKGGAGEEAAGLWDQGGVWPSGWEHTALSDSWVGSEGCWMGGVGGAGWVSAEIACTTNSARMPSNPTVAQSGL